MKKIIIILIGVLSAISVQTYAQQGYNYIYGQAGISYRQTYDFKIGVDIPNKYNNSWDISVRLNFDPDNHQEYFNAYLLGLAYKPCLLKGIDNMFRANFGLGAGTDLNKFLLVPGAGVEYIHSIGFGVDFLISSDLNYYFFAPQKNWRIYLNVGLRIRI